jgi:hypothetical protein
VNELRLTTTRPELTVTAAVGVEPFGASMIHFSGGPEMTRPARPSLFLAITVLLAAGQAAALERGRTADGASYVAGGVGFAERDELAAVRNDYSLRLVAAARGSGAFLADVKVRIADAHGRIVFDRTVDGPELLIDLPPGRYAVEASAASQTQRLQLNVDKARRQVYLYFDVPAEVLPKESATPR